jgi:hypothetical protein
VTVEGQKPVEVERIEISRLVIEVDKFDLGDPSAFGRRVESELRRIVVRRRFGMLQAGVEVQSVDAGSHELSPGGESGLALAVAERIGLAIQQAASSR